MDVTEASECDWESELGIACCGSCSSIAQYLTRKASGIDPSIKWRSMVSSYNITENLSTKSSACDRAAECDASRKRQRCETAEDLAANMLLLQGILDASIPGAREQYDEVHMSTGCFDHSEPGVLSRAATFIHRQDTENPVDLNELYGGHDIWPAENTERSCPTACQKASADSSFPDLSSLHSASDLRSLLSCSASRAPSMRISTHTAPQVTVLFIDIKGFTSACAAMPAARVGEWVADFYARVDAAAAAHGVAKAEVRGDCCICVAGAAGAVPSRAFAAADNDPCADQATRMLAFAAALHAALQTLSAGGAATATRMGIATGEASFLVSDGAVHFVRAQGEAAALAMQMEKLAAPGSVHVHHSAALRWAAEARRPPPPTARVGCHDAGREPQRAAVFDCAAGAFSPAEESASAAVAGGRGLRRSASALL